MARGDELHLSQEPVAWDRVEWRQGDGRYTFQMASGGLLATLTSPHGSKLTLPMVAWEGLLDALAAQRKTRTRAEAKFPRARARAGTTGRPASSPPPSRVAARSGSWPAPTTALNSPSRPSSTARACGTASSAARSSRAICIPPLTAGRNPRRRLRLPRARWRSWSSHYTVILGLALC
jgi:hypothetical protein